MDLVNRLNIVMAYAALAFLGAIILGMI